MDFMGTAVQSIVRSCRRMASLSCALSLAGLAIYWALWREPFLGTLFSSQLPGAYESRLWFYALLFACGALMLAFPTRERRLSKSVCLACGFAVSAGAAAIVAAPLASVFREGLVLAGAFLVVVGFIGLSLGWMRYLVDADSRSASLLIFASFPLSFASGFLDLVPGALPLFAVGMPLCSALALVFSLGAASASSPYYAGVAEAREREKAAEGAAEDAAINASSGGEGGSNELAHKGLFAASVAVCIAAGLLSSCMRSLWLYDPSGYDASPLGMITYAESFCIGCVFLLLRFKLSDFLTALMADLSVVLAFFLVGLLMCSFVGISSGLGLVSTAHTSLQLLLWVTIAQVSRERGLFVAGVLFVVEAALSVIVMYLLPRFVDMTAANSAAFALPLALWGMVFVAVAGVALTVGFLMCLFGTSAASVKQNDASLRAVNAEADVPLRGIGDKTAGEGSSAGERAEGEGSTGERVSETTERAIAGRAASVKAVDGEVVSGEVAGNEAVDGETAERAPLPYREKLAFLLAERYALTEREAQVAALIARGNSVKRTAELLCLASSTVQGYTKTIYRKMDIHRKQELVDVAAKLSPAGH